MTDSIISISLFMNRFGGFFSQSNAENLTSRNNMCRLFQSTFPLVLGEVSCRRFQ